MSGKRLKLSGHCPQSNGQAGDDGGCEDQVVPGPQFAVTFEPQLWEKIWTMESRFSDELRAINFKSDKNIAVVYNPLEYAADVHKNFMRKFLKKSPSVLFLGMNPGLFGMCQTSASDRLLFAAMLIDFISRCRFHSATFRP